MYSYSSPFGEDVETRRALQLQHSGSVTITEEHVAPDTHRLALLNAFVSVVHSIQTELDTLQCVSVQTARFH